MPLTQNIKSLEHSIPVQVNKSEGEPKSLKPQILSRLKGVAPWLVSLLILQQVLGGHDLHAVMNALASANFILYLLLLTFFIGIMWVMDAAYLAISYRWLAGVGSLVSLLRVRAAAYLLAIVSMFVGLGGIVFIMNKRFGVSYKRGTGIALHELYQEVGALGLLSLGAGLLFGGDPDSPLQMAIIFGFFAFAFYFACFVSSRYVRHVLKGRDPQSVLAVFSELSAKQFGALLGIKTIYNLIHGLFVALAFHCFAVEVPAFYAVACTQVVHFIHGLPISAFGIGVDQLSFSFLFAPWESSEGKILAFSVVYTFSLVFSRGLLGLLFVKTFFQHYKKESI